MFIVEEGDKTLLKFLGPARKKDTSYRLLKWCHLLECEEGILLHNYLTGQIMLASYEELKEIRGDETFEQGYERDFGLREEFIPRDTEINDLLIRDWFLFPMDGDDLTLIDQLRSASRLMDRRKGVSSYKILTTTDCNARCYYCYELGIKHNSMSKQTAKDISDYIIEHNEDSKVNLAWFGGEPLMEPDRIEEICQALREEGIEYLSIMTSNGYLFDRGLVQKAKDSWKLNNIQITLDGSHDAYNRIKAYKDPKDDPYFRVLNNIDLLLEAGIWVNVRLNLGLDNYEDLLVLIDELSQRFSSKEGFGVYVDGLFQEMSKEDSRKEKLMSNLKRLSEKLFELNLAKESFNKLKLRTGACMADDDHHRGFNPIGDVIKCEHHIEDKLIGHVNSKVENEEELNEWKKLMEDGPLCLDCPVRPACYKLKNCPISSPCSQAEYRQLILKNNKTILNIYNRWKGERKAENKAF